MNTSAIAMTAASTNPAAQKKNPALPRALWGLLLPLTVLLLAEIRNCCADIHSICYQRRLRFLVRFCISGSMICSATSASAALSRCSGICHRVRCWQSPPVLFVALSGRLDALFRSQPGIARDSLVGMGSFIAVVAGIDEAPKLVLIAIGAFFPVYMGVVSGIRGVDRRLTEVGQLYRLLTPYAMTRRILLPAALPAILTGLRNGLSLAWMFMVAAELIAASQGLGYLLTDGRETSRADIVLAAIALLALLGKISDWGMQQLEQHLLCAILIRQKEHPHERFCISVSTTNTTAAARYMRSLQIDIQRSEIVSLIGASGCGKSTLLSIIAGLDRDYRGQIQLEGKRLYGVSQDIGFIFQAAYFLG
jgi:sulfonate transport system permease protein